jgi:hypothetical protein
MNKLQLKAKVLFTGLQRRVFESITKKFVNETISETLADYPNNDTALELIQAVIDRYDEAIGILTNKIIIADNAFGHFKTRSSDELDTVSIVYSKQAAAIKLLTRSIDSVEQALLADSWEVKHSQAQSSYSTIRIKGNFKLSSLEETLTVASVHKYFRVYLDGCLLYYSQDYNLDFQDETIVVNFEDTITPGSNVILEAFKSI